ncbi:hypothetical protein HFK74_20675|uniref:hypothetical protein n=1 Tax=Pseudomonas sp. SbOxS1 TaxID=2723884 RepID=UPI0015D4316C|nr:hypothetical protein [Pseudomonas sp. SbOxS1]NYU05117.1 hypothetical protein [Pseudomonas sp. SbOxS1]
MQKIAFAIFMTSICSNALGDMSCHFDRFHQANHVAQDMTGYASTDQSMEIIGLKTSEATLKLDGSKRATNSTNWFMLERKGWETYTTTYAGDFGELLVIGHQLGENIKGLKGWYRVSLISSNIDTTHTFLGKCLIK